MPRASSAHSPLTRWRYARAPQLSRVHPLTRWRYAHAPQVLTDVVETYGMHAWLDEFSTAAQHEELKV